MDTGLAPVAPAPAAPQPVQAMAALVRALRRPECYPHAVVDVEVIETHISWVLLAGEFAYKLKKPVRLPFLDFSSAAARRHYCDEELRLNRRTAPGIYLGVVPISGDPAQPRVGPGEPVLEYAVKMRRFPQDALFSVMADAGRLEAGHVDALADAVARLHAGAERSSSAPEGPTCTRPGDDAIDNFAGIVEAGVDAGLLARLEPLRAWTCREAQALAVSFASRAALGFVRECHGDLHLANVALVDGLPVPFDGIEFSESMRWIDVASDVAFVAMDLERHGLARLAARFVNRYFERTGDYEALAVLRFYAVYRAMVRAKIAAFAIAQAAPGSARARERRAALMDYVAAAERLSRRGPALLVAMHGLSGSGKTTVSQQLVEALGAVRVRSDVERKRLRGLDAEARAGAEPGQGIYGEADGRATYERLAGAARAALAAGYPAIVDAAFLSPAQRERFEALARELGATFRVVACTAPEAVLRARVAARSFAGSDASDAGLAVLEAQMRDPGAPAPGEHALVIDTSLAGIDTTIEELAARLSSGTA